MRRRAFFLDRDGTIIRDVGYPRDPSHVEMLPDVGPALRTASTLGYALVLVSNQSGVGRGIIQPAEAEAVQKRVALLFAKEGVAFDGVYFCYHTPEDACPCRKPAPGMLRRAATDLGLVLDAQSLMIGDKVSDVEAGRAVGCTPLGFGNAVFPGAAASFTSWTEVQEWLVARGTPRE